MHILRDMKYKISMLKSEICLMISKKHISPRDQTYSIVRSKKHALISVYTIGRKYGDVMDVCNSSWYFH